jgi:hypothetical protein
MWDGVALPYRRIMATAGRSRRDRVVDAVMFALAGCFTLLALLDSVDRHVSPPLLAVDVILGGLGCLGVWLRRRWPVGFAVVMGVFSVFSLSAAGVALIALFTVAVHRRFAVVAPIVAGHALAAVFSTLVRPDLMITHWSQAALGIACVTAPLAWGAAGDGLTVEIRNPLPAGTGLQPPAVIPGAGAGIIGLAERAGLAGGRLEHGRTESGDFRLWAWLPWPA